MKKFFGFVGMAILGGTLTLGGYKMLFNEQVVINTTSADEMQTVKTSFNPAYNNKSAAIDASTIDFTVAAEKTLNAVVHVKNTAIRTQTNPYAEYLELPQSVFKPRRTNSHYLQFIEAITFYKQYQREKKYDEQTGEEFIETTIEDIKEANELIIEVLLRKSDTITGATRNYLESLKEYLKKNNQTTFTNAEIRRNLRIKETTLRRYNKQLLAENYIQRVKKVKTKSYCFEIVDVDEYSNLKEQINSALQNCITQIELAISPPTRHQQNGEVKTKKTS